MAHLILGMYAPPDVHEDFVTKVNNWRYEVEGKHRKGKMTPYISELKMYDVRIPESMIERFLRDMRVSSLESLQRHIATTQKGKGKLIGLFFRFFMKFNFLKQIPVPPKSERKYSLGKIWCNSYLVGKIDDDLCKNVFTKEEREVL